MNTFKLFLLTEEREEKRGDKEECVIFHTLTPKVLSSMAWHKQKSEIKPTNSSSSSDQGKTLPAKPKHTEQLAEKG